MKVLGIKASPRKRANSSALLEQLLLGVRSQGADVDIIAPGTLNIAPCQACNGCSATGRCKLVDDFQWVREKILECDALVLATPVYFGAVSAQVKTLIDRCQCFWSLTYEMDSAIQPGPEGARRKGVLIATAGQDREIMFACPKVTFKFLMNCLQADVFAELLYGGTDEVGSRFSIEEAMSCAFQVGCQLVQEMTG